MQKTFATEIYLVALTKLHKTLVPSVDEINGQQILHHLYTIVCNPYIAIKINNLHNDTCQMKKVWKKIVLRIDNGLSSFNLNGLRFWHMA